MTRSLRVLIGGALLCVAAFAVFLHMRGTVLTASHGRMQALPQRTLWTWERREDLGSIDPATTAVASLDRTVDVAGSAVLQTPQRNALRLPQAAPVKRIAVVRIQTHRPTLDDATAKQVANAVLQSLADPAGWSALQIDFDARQSERAWYRRVLEGVRSGMPATMPLSITALASWCSHDRWMSGLPIDEAVPMLFRMEPGVRGAGDPDIAVREPLCAGAVGISTRERWPADLRGKRIYLFADAGWSRDDPQKILEKLP